MVLVRLESFKGGSPGDQFVGEFALVIRMIVSALSTVDLLGSVLGFAFRGVSTCRQNKWTRETDRNRTLWQRFEFGVVRITVLLTELW